MLTLFDSPREINASSIPFILFYFEAIPTIFPHDGEDLSQKKKNKRNVDVGCTTLT